MLAWFSASSRRIVVYALLTISYNFLTKLLCYASFLLRLLIQQVSPNRVTCIVHETPNDQFGHSSNLRVIMTYPKLLMGRSTFNMILHIITFTVLSDSP